ncbi:MAG: hypothetical protein HP494_13155, partial [Nitrospira sp.]|nr:hypothetical protein [Nitrospira sp.]
MNLEFDRDNRISNFAVDALDGIGVLTKVLSPADASLPVPQHLHEQVNIARRLRSAAALYGYGGIARLCERLELICEQAWAIPNAEWPQAVGAMREITEGILTLVKAIGSGGSEDLSVAERCLELSAGLLSNKSTRPESEPVRPIESVPTAEAAMEAQQATHLYDDYFLPQLDPEVLGYFTP